MRRAGRSAKRARFENKNIGIFEIGFTSLFIIDYRTRIVVVRLKSTKSNYEKSQ